MYFLFIFTLQYIVYLMKSCNKIISIEKNCQVIFYLFAAFSNCNMKLLCTEITQGLQATLHAFDKFPSLYYAFVKFIFLEYYNTQCYKPLMELINRQMLPLFFLDLLLHLLVSYFTLWTFISFIFQLVKLFSHIR